MKKVKTLALLLLLSISAKAQEDLFTALQPLVDKQVEFVSGKYDRKGKFKIVKNKFGRPYWIVPYIKYNDEKEYTEKNKDDLDAQLDHYTHPAVLMTGKSSTSEHYVVVDKIVYKLWYCSEFCGSFKIVDYYIPMIEEMKTGTEKNDDSAKKKKGFFSKVGEKLAGAIGANSYVMAQQNVNHEQKVKDYFDAMKKVQNAQPYSAKVKAELVELKQDHKNEIDDINKTNADWWASEEGQAIRDRDALFAKKFMKIKNGRSYKITIGNGIAFKNTIGPGQSTQVDCSDSWYLYNGNSKGKKISSAGESCGQTVTVE